MTYRRAKITITFTDYWLGGTGGSGKGDIDVVAYRDADKCPALPMTQIKGTLRETARDYEIWDGALLDHYFGKSGSLKEDGAAVRFAGDASLNAADHAWFAANGDARAALFSTLRSTALNEKGVAVNQSLRTVEVCRPCTITKEVEWVGKGDPDPNWIANLNKLCQLTFAFGRMKNDGLGRAIATCEAIDDHSAGEVKPLTGALVLTLTPDDPASFSRNSATEGLHQSHAAPPGSALWGWAISQLYGDDKAKAYELFHSGAVKFSDAVPLIDEKTPAFPNPITLMYAKHDGAPFKDKVFQPNRIAVGREAFLHDKSNENEDGSKKQPEALTGCHISLALNQTVGTNRQHRLRTAIKEGQAEDGKLFGTEFVKAPKGYRATIEGAPEQLENIAKALPDGGRIFLGRARNSGYGGGYTCKWEGGNPWPEAKAVSGDQVSLWCLSDIALVDDFGMPMLDPAGCVFGLKGWILVPSKSSITTRRFAPWDRTESGRSSEICVIEAGSVLSYSRGHGTAFPKLEACVGNYQERGFGRVTILPEEPEPGIKVKPKDKVEVITDPSTALQKAAKKLAKERDTTASDAWLEPLLKILPAKAKAKGAPSKAQWSHVRNANHSSLGVEALREALGFNATNRKPLDDPRWEASGLRTWLNDALAAQGANVMPHRQLRYAVDQIVKTAKANAPKGDGGDRT